MEKATYHRGDLIESQVFKERVKRACDLMEKTGLDAVLLTKPQNITYLLGDGRLCAFAIIARSGASYVRVPKTDIDDTKKSSASEHILGFEDEGGMLHSIMHIWKELGLEKGRVGVENTFLKASILEMFIT
jgi:Xaa-Pro aminopeptidase